ncbi:MAG TPA: VOC family protein [Myxococcales bacterium]|nr:VOC family protein [Myxococcales bacterium]
MKNPPQGWPRISSALFYDDANAAIDWLGRAFGFETRLKVEGSDGGVVHSELVFGGGVVMVATASRKPHWKSPRSVGGANTQGLFAYVDDVEAHCARARAAGAKIVTEPKTDDYGAEWWTDRSYEAEDPEGHRWWFAQRLRNPSKEG